MNETTIAPRLAHGLSGWAGHVDESLLFCISRQCFVTTCGLLGSGLIFGFKSCDLDGVRSR
jgi:hypothetical protein